MNLKAMTGVTGTVVWDADIAEMPIVKATVATFPAWPHGDDTAVRASGARAELFIFVETRESSQSAWPTCQQLDDLRDLLTRANLPQLTMTPQEFEQEPDGTSHPYTGANIPGLFTFETGDGYLALDNTRAELIVKTLNLLPVMLDSVGPVPR